jgi:hypothetical protein
LFPAGFVGSPKWFRRRPQGGFTLWQAGQADAPPRKLWHNEMQGGAVSFRKEGLAHQVTRVPDCTLELVIASASASR